MKILICLDYSSFTESVLEHIKKFVQELNAASITVFHVIDEQLFYATTGYEVALNEEMQNESKLLKELCVQYLGSSMQYIEEYGIPKLEIDAAIKHAKHDLIIAGSHSRHGLGERLVGSIAEHILRNSKTPVLIIR